MSYYYWFNRNDLLKKAHDKYHNKGGKEKAVLHYQKNKEMIKQRERHKYQMMSREDRDEKKRKSLEIYYKLKVQYKE